MKQVKKDVLEALTKLGTNQETITLIDDIFSLHDRKVENLQEMTKEEFRKLSYTEMAKLFNEQPELYNKLKGE